MNPGAANIVVQGMLKGGYDVFDALLSLSFMYDTTDISDLSSEELGTLMDTYPVGLRGRIDGGGAVTMMYSIEDASRLVNLTNTGEANPKDALDEADIETFKEIADSALGGGVANLSEKFGQGVKLAGVEVVVASADGEGALRELLGDSVTKAAYQFSADPHFNSTSLLLFSQTLEDRVPPDLVEAVFGGEEGAKGDEPLVSDEEIQDILSGFDSGADSGNGDLATAAELPDNLSVILDIELIATVRLGHVELPIAEILNFGPGSIIEVGHLVDEPVELLVNDKLIARGDVVVVDEKFGLRITEIVSQEERIESLR